MAIRPPSWCKHAVPTSRGWCDPKSGELLKAIKIQQHMIDEFHGHNGTAEVHPVDPVEMEPELPLEPAAPEDIAIVYENNMDEVFSVLTEPEVEEAPEETSEYDDLEDMTKKELEELGREHGVELDRREKKSTLIEKMKDILG